ncbi:MAG: hypothetical protein WC505_06680 [Patescibacteria group bacterium]
MSLYANIRQAAVSNNKSISDEAVYRIAGTLKLAYDQDVPLSAILREIASHVEVTAATEKVSATEAIATALEHGTCPRCSRLMSEIKLADNTPSKYCTGCRIALW